MCIYICIYVYIYIYIHTEGERTERQIGIETDRETERRRDRETKRQRRTDGGTERQRDRQTAGRTDRQTPTDKLIRISNAVYPSVCLPVCLHARPPACLHVYSSIGFLRRPLTAWIRIIRPYSVSGEN